MNAIAPIVDMHTGEVFTSSGAALPALPTEPGNWPTARLAEACHQIYERRELIASGMAIEDAVEALRRAGAIERYVRGKEAKDAARRAARVLETAVGEALGNSEQGRRTDLKPIAREQQVPISAPEKARFRLLAKYRSVWWPKLQEVPLSRKQALELIDRARNPDDEQYDVGRQCCTTDDLHSVVARVESGEVPPFATILADPPWQYGNQGTRASNGDHYSGESVDWLCDPANMPIAKLTAPEAHLHLWTTNAFLFESKRIMEAWGFEYKSCYVWVKPQIGMGNYWRVSHEFLLLGVRGSLGFAARNLKSWGEFKRRQHSAKPEEIRDLIHVASPGPRLELFARRAVPGWWCWGNEIGRDIFASGADAA